MKDETRKARPALRWAVPVGAVAAVAVVGGFGGIMAAAADTTLPPRTAAQLLVDLQNAKLDPLSTTDPVGTTVRWRSQPRPQPEQYLFGARYLCSPTSGAWVVTDPSWFGYAAQCPRPRRIPGRNRTGKCGASVS